MSQRQEVEGRLRLFAELSGILGAMRSFALTELRRVSQREVAQQQVVDSLAKALGDLSAVLPAQLTDKAGAEPKDVFVLFGSARGFCGGFNEDILRFWQAKPAKQGVLILLGERLHAMFAASEDRVCIAGAESGLEAMVTIDRILAAVTRMSGADARHFRLWGCFRDEAGVRCEQLWPVPFPPSTLARGYLPLSYEPLSEVAAGVAEHYLFHGLLALLLRSIRVENHMRLMQMETALSHLERSSEDLLRQRNRLRQEEIVEEIELMIGGRLKV